MLPRLPDFVLVLHQKGNFFVFAAAQKLTIECCLLMFQGFSEEVLKLNS
jgi:hypothetical protein